MSFSQAVKRHAALVRRTLASGSENWNGYPTPQNISSGCLKALALMIGPTVELQLTIILITDYFQD